MRSAAKNNFNRLIVVTSFRERVDSEARRKVALADYAYSLRRFDELDLHAQSLLDMPARYEAIGKYYLGLAAQKLGRGSLNLAQGLFEQATEHAPDCFKARSILALGSLAEYRGDIQTELKLYSEVLKSDSLDYFSLIQTNRALAIAASREGNNAGAAKHLETFLPVAKVSPDPRLYFDYLNSLAVELGTLGRVEEARYYINLALRSPYALICPEYQETANELREQRREAAPVVVAVSLPARQYQRRPRIDFSFLVATDHANLPTRIIHAPLAIANLRSRAALSTGPRAPPIS